MVHVNHCIAATVNASNASDHDPLNVSSGIALAMFYGLLSVVIVVSNVGNLFALPHTTADLGANTVFLFRALALIDLLTGIFGSGGKFVDFIIHQFADDSKVFTAIKSILSVLCINYSLLILGCVSLNRYFLIAMPFRYKVVTHRQMVIVIVIVIIVGALQGFGGYMYSFVVHWRTGEPYCYFQVRNCRHIYDGYIVLYLFIPVIVTVVITFTNLSLLVIVLDHKRRIKKQLEVVQGGITQAPKQRNIKGITTPLLVVLVFYMCCAPAFFFDSYRMATSNGDCLPRYINDSFTALLFSNSCMNSFIYLFTLKSFRKAFKRKLICRRSEAVDNHTQLEIRYDD